MTPTLWAFLAFTAVVAAVFIGWLARRPARVAMLPKENLSLPIRDAIRSETAAANLRHS